MLTVTEQDRLVEVNKGSIVCLADLSVVSNPVLGRRA